MFGKVLAKFRKNPFLVLLCLILIVISVGMIKPNFYLMGWDNYSSYFNLKTNLFRTFFATWREYRGLGVPSDAEVTDIFRLILQWILHFFVKEELLDQVYYVASLWVGVLSVYGLAKMLFAKHTKKKQDWQLDMVAGISALFYLFNLNTLSVFYAPMIPFVNRFWGLPALLWSAVRWDKMKTRKSMVVLMLCIFFSSGTYVTPTVMITNLTALFVFGIFYFGFKKTVLYEFIFVLLNAFWLLPFINYVIEKSSIVPLARIFTEINESLLNPSAENFSLEKQLNLYPSFLSMKYNSISGAGYRLHPLLSVYESNFGRIILGLFPGLYLLGGGLALIKFKKNIKLLWLVGWLGMFLFLSAKEFGPFGFAYVWLKHNIPFFAVIFRIGDTKFHTYISLAGSLLAGYTTLKLGQTLKRYKYVFGICFFVIFVAYGCLFVSYFKGQLIGFYSYTKVPLAYKNVADYINKEEGDGRVLHLPTNGWYEYWRSYSWGYFGSAWFDFWIDKAYIDRTFEPASMENAYLHNQINFLMDQFSISESGKDRENAIKFYELAKRTGIGYLLVDESIENYVYARNLFYANAKQYGERSMKMVAELEKLGLVDMVKKYEINMEKEIYPYYEKLYPVSKIGYSQDLPKETGITLYKLKDFNPMFLSVGEAKEVDSKLNNLLETNIIFQDNILVQGSDESKSTIYPFVRQNHEVSMGKDLIELDYGQGGDDQKQYKIKTGENKAGRIMVDIYGQIEEGKLRLWLYDRYLPNINGKEFKLEIGSIEFDIDGSVNKQKLMIGEVIVDIEADKLIAGRDRMATLMLDKGLIDVKLLEKTESRTVNLNVSDDGQVFYGDLKSFGGPTGLTEIGFQAIFELNKEEVRARSVVEGVLLEQGDRLMGVDVCIYQGESRSCLNTKTISWFDDSNLTRNVDVKAVGHSDIETRVEIKGVAIEDDIIKNFSVNELEQGVYEEKDKRSIVIEESELTEELTIEGKLVISVPRAESIYSYDWNRDDSLLWTEYGCGEDNYRTYRIYDGNIFTYIDNCDARFGSTFRYKTDSPYLFAIDYWVGNGQQTNVLLGKSGDDYFLERIGLYQDYPNFEGMGQFRDRPYISKKDVTEILKSVEFQTNSRLIGTELRNMSAVEEASLYVFQHTYNQGVMAVGDIVMMEYPSDWYDMELVPKRDSVEYVETKIIDSKRILPSWWLLKVKSGESGKALIRFGQAYDRQWGIYKNGLDMILGKSVGGNSRCDGWANCFEVEVESGNNEFYVFYWPEVLATAGWILSLSTAVALISFKRWKR